MIKLELTEQEQVHLNVQIAIESWLDDRLIYMSPVKKKELVNLILRIVDATYADGYANGQQSKGVDLCKCTTPN